MAYIYIRIRILVHMSILLSLMRTKPLSIIIAAILTINRKLWFITIVQLPSSLWSQNWFPKFAQYHIHHNYQPISQVSRLFWNAILPPIYIQLPRKQEFGWLWSCHQLLAQKSSSKISCSRCYRMLNLSLDKETPPVLFMIDQVLLSWDSAYMAF